MIKYLDNYLILLGLFCVCFFFFSFDKSQLIPALSPGLVTVGVEILFEIFVIYRTLRSGWTLHGSNSFILGVFLFLFPADLSYLVLHYWLKVSHDSAIALILTSLPYSLAYLTGTLGFLGFLRKQVRTSSIIFTSWLPLLLLFSTVVEILIPTMLLAYQKSGWGFFLAGRALNTVFSISLFVTSILTLIFSNSSRWSFFALGSVLLQVGNWGLAAAIFHGGVFTLTEYEFLWLCGVATLSFGAFIQEQSKQVTPLLSIRESIGAQSRLLVITLVCISTLIAVNLLERGPWSYRLIFFGVGVGGFIALVLADLFAGQIVYYSGQFGKMLRHPQRTADVHGRLGVPIELQSLFESAFEIEILNEKARLTLERKVSSLATQVAHDIRSPLAALEIVVRNAAHFSEEERVMVRSAVSRIRDIANDLLLKNRESQAAAKGHEVSTQPRSPTTQLISGLVDLLVTEKRIQYRSKTGIEIEAQYNSESYGLFSRVDPTEFKRLLSNLINNSVEAFRSTGKISVSLEPGHECILLKVSDNGGGIPQELLQMIGNRGVTHGKEGGSGLGVYHARNAIETWGGTFKINSEIGVGTQVLITLPQVPPPPWFVPELILRNAQTVAILDDDDVIHQIWKRRFDTGQAAAHKLEIHYFSTGNDLKIWLASINQNLRDQILFLCDYELLGQSENGMQVIGNLGIEKSAVLVTSRFEESEIRASAEKLGVKLIPKGMAGFVPIRFQRS